MQWSAHDLEISELGSLIARCDGLYQRWNRMHGFPMTVHRILLSLSLHGPATQRSIARAVCAPKQTINNVVRQLASEGLVELSASERDGREKLVSLTEAGRARADEMCGELAAFNERVYRRLDDGLTAELRDAMAAYVDAVARELAIEELERGARDDA